MKVIFGHTNTDLDCLGSMVLARFLYPDHRLVLSRFIHPVAQNLYNMYKDYLDFLSFKELKEFNVESVVVVDTRSMTRVKEFFDILPGYKGPIIVYDHHPSDSEDIPGAELYEGMYGANTTFLGLKLLEKGIEIDPQAATIALTGIYADTGNFTHENVTREDFEVAAFLKKAGASINIVKHFLKPLSAEHQITLFHEVLNRLSHKNINGHPVILSYIEMPKQESGLAAIVEKTFEVENPDAYFAVFHFQKEGNSIIIARSQRDSIELNSLLGVFGGGGHPKAASAVLKVMEGPKVFHALERYLETALKPALCAKQIMTKNVICVKDSWTLLETSLFLEKIEHTGAPVLNDEERLVGFVTLRDIMKGRKANRMHAPVKGYMSRNVISGTLKTTIREIEKTMQLNNIGHLPIVEEERVVGIITRSDYLAATEKQPVPEPEAAPV